MSKYFPFLFLLVFSLLFIGCAEDAPRQGYLKSDALIPRHFNKYQIEDLEKLMAFFEEEICQTVPATSEAAVDCYLAFSKSLADKGNFGDLNLGLSLEKQQAIMDSIRPVTFNALWLDQETYAGTASSFGLNYDGQYATFLKVFGRENEAVKQYFDVFDQAGHMTPSMIANVLLEYEKFGLEDQRGRLVLAIHYLTLNRMMTE